MKVLEAEISQLKELVKAMGKEAFAEQLSAKKCQWLQMLEVSEEANAGLKGAVSMGKLRKAVGTCLKLKAGNLS